MKSVFSIANTGEEYEDEVNWLKHKRTDFISSDYSKKFAEYKIYMELLLQAMAD